MNRKDRRAFDKKSDEEKRKAASMYIEQEINRILEEQIPASFYRGWLYAYADIREKYINDYNKAATDAERVAIADRLVDEIDAMEDAINKEMESYEAAKAEADRQDKEEEEKDKEES